MHINKTSKKKKKQKSAKCILHELLETSTILQNSINGETLPLRLNGFKISPAKITADLSNLTYRNFILQFLRIS